MRPLFSPALAVALVSLCVTFFVLVYQWARPVPQCNPVFDVKNDIGLQRDDVPILVVGSSASDAAISRAEGGGKTIIFENGFTVGAHHRYEVVGARRDKTLLIYEDDGYSTVMASFVGRDIILGDAPFSGAKGLGDVYIAGFAYGGVYNQWEQTSVYHFADGISVYSVLHTRHPGLRGTQLVSPSQDIDLVLASDGMIYIGNVEVGMRNANKGPNTVLVGGRVVIEEVYKNVTFDCIKIIPTTAKRFPTLLTYDGSCGSYTQHTVVCVFDANARVEIGKVCNSQLLQGYLGITSFQAIAALGSCDGDSPDLQVRAYRDMATTTDHMLISSITPNSNCEQNKYRWVCMPRQSV